MRSFKGAFAWVTSPLLLTLAKRDLCGVWGDLGVPSFPAEPRGARVKSGANGAMDSICMHDGRVYLQDLDLAASADGAMGPWAEAIARSAFSDGDIFTKRFVVVDDDTMAFLWETATQVDQRIRINDTTRVVDSGALWREESLPPETLLIGLLESGPGRKKGHTMAEDEVLKVALPTATTLQFGGKATIGRGRCRMIPIN